MRPGLLLPLLSLALLLPACGGGDGVTTAVGGAAEVVPASAIALVTVDTDLDSSQWNMVDQLLDRFPAKERLLTMLRASFEEESEVSWENDVKPALGDTIELAVIDSSGEPTPIFLLQPNDRDKFDELVRKLNESETGDDAVTGELEDWVILADNQADLDAFRSAASGAKLEDDADYQDAIADLDDETLVRAFVDGEQVGRAVRDAMSGLSGGGANAEEALRDFRTGALQLVALDEGFELTAIGRRSETGEGSDYTPELLDVAPSGALAFLSFRGGTDNPRMQAGLGSALGAMPQLAPLLDALEQLTPLLANENALWVLQGFPIPAVTLVAQPDNPVAGVTAVRGVATSLTSLAGGAAELRPTTIDGVPATEIDLGDVSVFFGRADEFVFVSTSRQVVAQLRESGGQKLADDPVFMEAQEAAGMPEQSAGFLYVNLKDTIPLVESLAQLGDESLPPDVAANLRHLRAFLAYSSAKPDETRVTAFLGIT